MNQNVNYNVFYDGGTQLCCPICKNIVTQRICPFCFNDMTGEFNRQYSIYMQNQQYQQSQQYQQQSQQYQQNQQNIAGQLPYHQAPQYTSYADYSQKSNPYLQAYSPYAVKKNPNSGLIVGISIAASFLIVIALSLLIAFSSNTATDRRNSNGNQYDAFQSPQSQYSYHSPDGISKEEFEKLKNGLSYAHVSALVGGDGILINNGETLQKEDFYTYAWAGEYVEETIVYITFTNDVVTDISLEGTLE